MVVDRNDPHDYGRDLQLRRLPLHRSHPRHPSWRPFRRRHGNPIFDLPEGTIEFRGKDWLLQLYCWSYCHCRQCTGTILRGDDPGYVGPGEGTRLLGLHVCHHRGLHYRGSMAGSKVRQEDYVGVHHGV